MRLWPLFGAAFGEEGGVSEPALLPPRLLIYKEQDIKGKGRRDMRKGHSELQEEIK